LSQPVESEPPSELLNAPRGQLFNKANRPKAFQLHPHYLISNREVSSMSQQTAHVKLRCMECKAKFDSKYDAFDTSAITNVGQILQNFIFCQRCGKRVSVVVFDIR